VPTVEELEQLIQPLVGGSLDARKGSLAHQIAKGVVEMLRDTL
jgi:hypothetical protein